MIIDQDTQATETENSEASETTTSSTPSKEQEPSSTDQQTADDDKVDLGTNKSGDEETTEKETSEEEDTRTDEEKAADEERAKLFGAPEGDAAYELTLPEGFDVDKEALEAITPIAKQLNLSNDGLSAIAAVYAEKVLPNVAQKVVDNLNQDVADKHKEWEGLARDLIAGKGDKLETLSGEEINFNGLSLKEVQKISAKTLDKYAPAGFREWLDETGLGVHPQMIALAYNVGREIAEDREVETTETGRKRSNTGGGRPMTDTSKFYGH